MLYKSPGRRPWPCCQEQQHCDQGYRLEENTLWAHLLLNLLGPDGAVPCAAGQSGTPRMLQSGAL